MCYESNRSVSIVVSEDRSTDKKELIQAFWDPEKAKDLADKLNDVNVSVMYSVVDMKVAL